MKILSIDWDYFINCSEDFRAVYFPDGGNEDIGLAMSTFVWTRRYAANRDIEQVKVLESDIDLIKKIVDKNKDRFYFICADSHKHLGEFLTDESMQEKLKGQELEIVNIDHHHDAYNIGEKLNCGNWVNKVLEMYPETKVKWIKNCDSQETENDKIERISFKDIENESFEIIYLCRSGIWSPPHLDKQFGVLNRFINKRAGVTLFREEIVNRWDSDFQKDVKQTEQFFKDIALKSSEGEKG